MRIAIVLASLLAAGCTGKVAPSILGVELCQSDTVCTNPPVSPLPGDKIDARVEFADQDDGVVSITIAFPSTGQNQSFTLPQVVYSNTIIHVGVQFPSNTPAGAFEIDFAVTDESGLVSPTDIEMVSVQ
jgi:hypothetical protein